MTLGNVLVIGSLDINSEALAQAVFAGDMARDDTDADQGIAIYESTNYRLPLRIVDARALESTLGGRAQATLALKKWAGQVAGDGASETNVHVIWLCVEMTPKGPSHDAVRELIKVQRLWKNVPVIALITKTSTGHAIEQDIAELSDALARHKHMANNLRGVLCLNGQSRAADNADAFDSEAVIELVDTTFEHLTEGRAAADKDAAAFRLRSKRSDSRHTIAAYSSAGALLTALPLPFPDALMLTVLEAAEMDSLAALFEVRQEDTTKKLIDMVVELGTIGVAARAAIQAIGLIPGVRLKAGITKALVAGLFIAAIGEGASLTFEQVYLGKVSLNDLGWVRKFMESEIPQNIIEQLNSVLAPAVKQADNANNLGKTLSDLAVSILSRMPA